MTELQEQKKKNGCGKKLAIGCLTVIVLAAAGGFFAYRNLTKIVDRLSAEFVSAAPADVSAVDVTDQEKAEIFKRVDAFSRALKEGPSGQELTLTSRDLNVLIQKNPGWAGTGGKAYVTLEGDRIHGDVSIPLDKFGTAFKGRWLNGAGTFRVETAAGRLLVFMDALSVRDKALPEKLMAGLRNKNLAEDAAKKPETAALLAKLDSVTVRDGKLRIKSK